MIRILIITVPQTTTTATTPAPQGRLIQYNARITDFFQSDFAIMLSFNTRLCSLYQLAYELFNSGIFNYFVKGRKSSACFINVPL